MKTTALIQRYALTSVAQPVLQANPRRVAIHCSVVSGVAGAGTVETQSYPNPGRYTFTVPPGITVLDSIKVLGSGGNGDAGVHLASSSAGGGGGGFSQVLAESVVSGDTYTVKSSYYGSGAYSYVQDNSTSAIICSANSGSNAIGATPGAGASTAGAVGSTTTAGGDGGLPGTPNGGYAGGGGGCGGLTGSGSSAAAGLPGVGNSPGGDGGGGASPTGAATNGSSPGGGGGGGSGALITPGIGGNGLVIISWTVPLVSGPWSLSQSNGLVLGQATWNFMGTQSAFLHLRRCDYGQQICEQFWAIAGPAGVTVEITEILCEDEEYLAEGH